MINRKYRLKPFVFIFAVFIFLSLSFINLLISLGTTYTVRISFEKNKEAKYYEVLWLTADNELIAGKKFPPGSYIQKAVDSPFTSKINSGIKFFRIRSVYSADIYGAWSRLYKIDVSHIIKARQQEEIKTEIVDALPAELQGLFKIISVGGRKKLFFIAEKLPLEPLSEKKEFYYSVNKSRAAVYETALNPTASGEYTINLYYKGNDKIPFKTLKFYIDKRSPMTFLGIYPPFYSSRNMLYLNENAHIELRAADPYSGIKNIYYRIYPVGDKPPSFMPALEKIFVKEFTPAIEKDFSVEYFAEDMMENKENIGIAYFFIDTLPPRIKNYSLKFGKITFLEVDDVSTPLTLKVFSNGKLYYNQPIFETIDLIKGKDIPESGKITFEITDMLKNKTVADKVIP